jgi:hypothetical protein
MEKKLIQGAKAMDSKIHSTDIHSKLSALGDGLNRSK